MSEINDILLRSTTGATDRGPSLAARLAIGGTRSSRAEGLARLAGSRARIAQDERLALREARLGRAAEALSKAAPESAITTEVVGRRTTVERVARSETVTIEEEVTTPAGPALQLSFAFADPDQNAVGSSGQIRFGLRGPNVRIDVPSGGATLTELADLVNQDSQNGGRLLASVVESDGSYRLRVETTATGSSERVRINRDDFGLFDPALAQEDGTDESTELVERDEEIIRYVDVVTVEDVEAEILVGDDAFLALAEEFVGAFNALRAELGTAGRSGSLLTDPELSSRRSTLGGALTGLLGDLETRSRESDASLAELGLEAAGGGALRIESAAFQQAIAERPTAVIELFASGPQSLARNVTGLLSGATGLVAQAASAASELTTRGRLDQLSRLLAPAPD